MAYLQSSGIQYAQGNLNSAAILAMNTTAQTLLAAPGAGLMNLVIAFFMNVKVGSTAWTAMGPTWLVYGTTGNDQTNLASSYMTNEIQTMSASTNYVVGGTYGAIGADVFGTGTGQIVKVLSSNAINKVIAITCIDAVTPAGANGNIDWKMWYTTVPAV